MLPLTDAAAEVVSGRTVAISAGAGTAVTVSLQAKQARACVPRSKMKLSRSRSTTTRRPSTLSIRKESRCAGSMHDPMLYSYLLDPTYSSHRLPEVALRRFNLKLSGTLAESADVTGRFAAALRRHRKQAC